MTTNQPKHAVMTDAMLKEFEEKYIGKPWKPHEPYYNTQVTRDSVRHFADGIGDTNPLFRDPAYAKKSEYGCVPAPPCFVFSIWWPGRAIGLPGIHGWDSGKDFRFYLPMLEGDTIDYEVTYTSLKERPSQTVGRVWMQHSDNVYTNQDGKKLLYCDGWTTRAERASAGSKGANLVQKGQVLPGRDFEGIMKAYEAEIIRGAEPRYWEDVNVGDTLQPVVKGPLTVRDMIVWLMGAGSPYMRAHKIFFDFQHRHASQAMIDSTTGQTDAPELVHMEASRAQEIGIRDAYDYGHERMSWMGNLLTNWMGDNGFIKKFYAMFRRFNMVGDTTWLMGKVIKKYIDEDGEPVVDIECWGENQRGEVTMPGSATIALPSKVKKTSPVKTRMQLIRG